MKGLSRDICGDCYKVFEGKEPQHSADALREHKQVCPGPHKSPTRRSEK